jgi:hypothetical protein
MVRPKVVAGQSSTISLLGPRRGESADARFEPPRNRKSGPSVILVMMVARSRWFAACVVTLMLLVGGCSRPSGSSADDAAKRGPCPTTYPAASRHFSLKAENAGVRGLGTSLVPFPAQQVRVCRYDSGTRKLTGAAELNDADAARLEASANRLRTRTTVPTHFACHQFDTALLTFTTPTEGMAVAVAECGSGVASNGTLTVTSTRAWLDALPPPR